MSLPRPVPLPGAGDVVALFAANVLFAAGLFAHAFLYNFYLEALGLGEAVMGVAAAALTAGGLTALVPAGLLVDRLGPRGAYACAAAVGATGLALGAWVVSPVAVYLAAAVAGAGTAAWRVAMGPLVMAVASPAMRTRIFSWNVALLLASGAAWTAAAGAVPRWLEAAAGGPLAGLRAGLLMGALGTLLSAAALLAVRARADRAGGAEGSGAEEDGRTTDVLGAAGEDRHAANDSAAGAALPGSASRASQTFLIPPRLAAAVVAVWLWMTAGGLVIPFFNLYFVREHGLPIERVGLLLAAAQAVTALAVFGSGEWASRAGPLRALASWTLLFPPLLLGLAFAPALGPAVALFFLQGFVPPATNPLIDQLLLERAAPGRHGVVSGWRNGATELAGLVGSSSGGFILQAGSFALLLSTAGGVALLGGVGMLLALRRLGPVASGSPALGAHQPTPS